MCTASRSRHRPTPADEALASVDALLRSVANRYASPWAPAEDLWQEARIAFVEALPRYDPSVSRLSTWAVNCAHYAALKYIRDSSALVRKPAWLWERNEEGDREHIARSWEDNDHLRESGRDERQAVEGDVLVSQLLSVLTGRQRQVMELYLIGWPAAMIGRSMRLSEAVVRQYRHLAVRRLRSHFEEELCS